MNTEKTQPTAAIMDIPLNLLVPSKSNVRRKYSQESIEELAASLATHGLLHNLTVKTERDENGKKTGRYEVPAGGRRLAALKLRAKRKEIAKNAPIPCAIREDGDSEELSLAENIEREQLNPADEFEAFKKLVDKGADAGEIAARFGKSVRFVRERLKLAAVSPKLFQLYRDEQIALDQLMAFAVTDDHVRQEEVWENLSYEKSPWHIRRALLQGHVSASDRRVMFVGVAAYEAAGGIVVRDFFSEDGGGYLADPALLDRLARAKLDAVADGIRGEGWKWVECAIDFPHGQGWGRVYARDVELSEADMKRMEEIEAELDALQAEAEEMGEINLETQAKLAVLNAEYDGLDARSRIFESEDIARAGVIVTLGHDGRPVIGRGLVRPEDEQPDCEEVTAEEGEGETDAPDEAVDDIPKELDKSQLSYRLIAELSAHRTLALRDALAGNADLALIALTHALALQTFYPGSAHETCLDMHARSSFLEAHAPGIGGSVAARNIAAREEAWAAQLPKESEGLWDYLVALDPARRMGLLAHCVSLGIDAVMHPGKVRGALLHAKTLANALHLDMRTYWTPGSDNYFLRVSKSMILEAVREGISEQAGKQIADLKKPEMALAAVELLKSTVWLPEILRTTPTPIDHSVVPQAQAAE